MREMVAVGVFVVAVQHRVTQNVVMLRAALEFAVEVFVLFLFQPAGVVVVERRSVGVESNVGRGELRASLGEFLEQDFGLRRQRRRLPFMSLKRDTFGLTAVAASPSHRRHQWRPTRPKPATMTRASLSVSVFCRR